MNIHNFVADRLSDVVHMKHRRQIMMVHVLAVLGVFFLAAFSTYSFYRQDWALATVLGVYSIAGVVTTRMVYMDKPAGVCGLTFIIYSLSAYLIYTGGFEGTGLMWAYPLSAIGIFINPFARGLALSVLNVLVLSALFYLEIPVYEYSSAVSFRFVLTLVALSGMCHIVIYFQSRMDDYILKMHDEGIQDLAYMDSLTLLANRASFLSVLSHADIGSKSKAHAIIYLDLDNFKALNDKYGHDMGDVVLNEFAQALKRVAQEVLGDRLHKYDVARLGGDEFAVFVRQFENEQEVVTIGEQAIALFDKNQLQSLDDIDVKVNVSVGIAFDSQGSGLRGSLRTADKAMYQAKRAGHGRLSVIQ